MTSFEKPTEHYFVADGGIVAAASGDDDPFNTLDDLMAVIEVLCPTFAGSKFIPECGPIQTMKTGRNDPRPCGRGKKYKQCCLAASVVAATKAPEELA